MDMFFFADSYLEELEKLGVRKIEKKTRYTFNDFKGQIYKLFGASIVHLVSEEIEAFIRKVFNRVRIVQNTAGSSKQLHLGNGQKVKLARLEEL